MCSAFLVNMEKKVHAGARVPGFKKEEKGFVAGNGGQVVLAELF